MNVLDIFDRKNLILISSLCFFAILCIVYFHLSSKNSFYSGFIGIFLIILYPTGAFFYGYQTGDKFRAPLFGIISYAFLILLIILSGNFQDHLSQNYLLLFTGYHMTLLICLGFIGYIASQKEKMQMIISGILCIIWILIFLSGIS